MAHALLHPRALSATAFLLCTAAGSTARAEARPLVLEYHAPASCPTATTFAWQIQARTPLARFGTSRNGAVVYRVVLTHSETIATGHLEVEDGTGESKLREMEGATCEEVASALALIVALAIDPQAKLGPTVEPPPEPPPALPRLNLAPLPSSAQPRKTGSRFRLREFDIGTAFWGGTAMSPGVLYGVSLLALPRFGFHSPLFLRISVQVGSSGRQSFSVGAGRFDYVGGELSLCPLGYWRPRLWGASLCAGLFGGRMQAAGLEVSDTGGESHGLIGLQGRVQTWWRTSGGPAFVGGIGGWGPLGRRTYVFDQPRTVLWVQPSFGILFDLGLSFSIL